MNLKKVLHATINVLIVGAFIGAFAAIIVSLTLYTSDSFRHKAFRAFAETPSGVFYYLIRGEVISRRFGSAASHLQKQLDFIGWVRGSQNIMVPGLIENTRFVVNVASTPAEWQTLTSYLTELDEKTEGIYLTDLWLGRALARQDPIRALEHLDQAAAIAGPDPEPYRYAIRIAYENGMTDQLKSWCVRYQNLQFGGTRSYDYNNRFLETSMRRTALRITDSEGEVTYFGHQGLMLNQSNKLAFAFDRPRPVHDLALEFGVSPGVVLDIGEVRIETIAGTRTYTADQVHLFPKHGFNLQEGVVTTSQDGEVIGIGLEGEAVDAAIGVDIVVDVSRAGLAGANLCGRMGR